MSTTYRRRRLSEAEREQRRSAERERVKEAAEQLLTSEGWQRWVRARSMFRRYSACNCMLIALDFHLRGIEPEPVAGFRAWLKLGRCVRKGEHGIRIAARVTPKKADPTAEAPEPEQTEERDRRPVRFTTVAVFGLSQTDPLPGVEQLPLEPPCEPLTGDSHAHLLEPLGELAAQLGYTVTFEEITGATGGWCDPHAKQIVVDSSQAVNGQVRTLVHEIVHALGVDYQTHSRPQAEVIVDTATLIILNGAGLDTSGETIPYVAGWGETGALEAVTEHAELIDRLARTVENAISGDTANDAADGRRRGRVTCDTTRSSTGTTIISGIVGSPAETSAIEPCQEQLLGTSQVVARADFDERLGTSAGAWARERGKCGERELGVDQVELALDRQPAAPPGRDPRVAVRLELKQRQANVQRVLKRHRRELGGRRADHHSTRSRLQHPP